LRNKHGAVILSLRGNKAEVTDMLFKEYDSAAHIASEKDISYEEGFEDGRTQEKLNTEREKQRADHLQMQNDDLHLQNTILLYKAQGKSNEEIGGLMALSESEISQILEKLHLK